VSEDKIRRVGLARALSKLGYCSRSAATRLIHAGRVTLNGKLRLNPETPVSETHDRIQVDGSPVDAPARIYLMMNKPRGTLTTASDDQGRETVYSLLKDRSTWLAPVGRLDKASEGLLLLTNDSEWSARVASPETHLEKTYHVQLAILADKEFIRDLVAGVKARDGELLRARHARLLRSGEKTCWLEIILQEGRNRQIRRIMESRNVEVLRLIRVAIGPLPLGDLAKGATRPLTPEEKRMLDGAIQTKLKANSRRMMQRDSARRSQ